MAQYLFNGEGASLAYSDVLQLLVFLGILQGIMSASDDPNAVYVVGIFRFSGPAIDCNPSGSLRVYKGCLKNRLQMLGISVAG